MNKAEQYLAQNDGLTIAEHSGKVLYLHQDHRWVLPLVVQAQEDGLLPRPCTLVGHDYHHDALLPGAMGNIKAIVRSGVTVEAVIKLCAEDLRTLDDDWIMSGIELGLFRDVVIFGVERSHNADDLDDTWAYQGYTDHCGASHTIWTSGFLPGEILDYQGDLSDLARSDELGPLWEALGWHSESGRFAFLPDAEPILLDFDLDCFSVEVRGCRVRWPDEVFQEAFFKAGYGAAKEWTGKRFLDSLVKRAGIITIAREPGCCGGEKVADQIWEKLSSLLKNNG